MTAISRPKALLLRDPARPSLVFEKIALVLQKLSELEIVEAGDAGALQGRLQGADAERRIFLDSGLIAKLGPKPEPALRSKRITLVATDGMEGTGNAEWRKAFSCLNVAGAANIDLPRLLQLALSQESNPGIFALADRGSEIFYEKVKGLADIGAKVDRLVAAVEKKNPELAIAAFNLRQLSYAILHHAFGCAPKVAGLASFVDFQAVVNEDRIAFATSFNSNPGSLTSIIDGMMTGSDPVWHTAWLCADALVVTEVQKSRIVEAKALLASDARYSSSGGKTVLFRAIEEFAPDANSLALQKGAKLLPLEPLGGGLAGGPEALGASGAPGAAGEADGNASGTQLNFKLKADMLENERSTLQCLVKKKNHLITELNKDVNRAQRETMLAKNSALKELRQMRFELEKAQGAAHQATARLERIDRLAEQNKANATAAASVERGESEAGLEAPMRDFEKDRKQAEYTKRLADEKIAELSAKSAFQDENLQKLRRELDASKAETNELKAKYLKLEKSIEHKARVVSVEAKDVVAQEGLAEKMKELQKQLGESRMTELELDKEVKRLTLKLESADQSVKGIQTIAEKRLEVTEKQLEEAKRKVTDVSKKLEDERTETRTQLEDWKQKERELRKRGDDLAELVRLKVEEMEKATNAGAKKSAELQAKVDEQQKKAEEQQRKFEELAKSLKSDIGSRKVS